MKFLNLFAVLVIGFGPAMSFAALPSACVHAYLNSDNAEVKTAGAFLFESQDDYDYTSVSKMASAIRTEKNLAAWSHPTYIDLLNVAICDAVASSADAICGEQKLTLAQIQSLLSTQALPKYYQSHSVEAKMVQWNQN